MIFDVSGPHKISRHGPKRLINEQSLKDLLAELRLEDSALEMACGCYVFAIRAGKGITPYYVGQASKSTIVREAFNPANRERYNSVLNGSSGTPIIFLLPMRTPTGKYRKKKSGAAQISSVTFLERWLIAKALEKNENLLNSRETRFLRNLHVRGLFNAQKGEATAASRKLVSTLK